MRVLLGYTVSNLQLHPSRTSPLGNCEEKYMSDPIPPQMPSLEDILERGLQKLLGEVRRRNITQPPYGRPPTPSPLLSEEAFVSLGSSGADDGDDSSDDPVFRFDYGFNPLKFLADYVLWSHPSSFAAREVERERAAERLRFRAQHAIKQLVVSESLRLIAKQQGSGILWGPLTSPAPAGPVTAVLQALRDGWIVLQVSTDASFGDVACTVTIKTACTAAAPTKLTVPDLAPGTRYFVRCCLEDETAVAASATEDDSSEPLLLRFVGLDMERYQECSFWTLPSQEPVQLQQETPSDEEKAPAEGEEDLGFTPLTLVCLGADTCHTEVNMDFGSGNEGLVVTALLGDVFPSMPADSSESNYQASVARAYRSTIMTNAASPCRSALLLFGWHDCSFRSDVDARSEEITHRQFMHDSAKHLKKYGSGAKKQSKATDKVPPPAPTLHRPPLSVPLATLCRNFPVDCVDSSIRHVYRSYMLGPDVEVFVLDFRSGYLCKEEAKWLKEGLGRSQALWKVVLSGMPIALMPAPESPVLGNRPLSRERSSRGSILTSDSNAVTMLGEQVSKVQMDVPELPENRDVDELGRAKNSLPYLIFSLQRSAVRKSALLLEEGSTDDASHSVEEMPINEASVSEEVVDAEDGTVSSFKGPETIDSGIVFVTCNSASVGYPHKRYVATFDPVKAGRSFCAEVNVGSVAAPSGSLRPSVTPHLETRFLDGDEGTLLQPASVSEEVAHSCVLRLEKSGALTIRLMALTHGQRVGEPVYEQSFRVRDEEAPVQQEDADVPV